MDIQSMAIWALPQITQTARVLTDSLPLGRAIVRARDFQEEAAFFNCE